MTYKFNTWCQNLSLKKKISIAIGIPSGFLIITLVFLLSGQINRFYQIKKMALYLHDIKRFSLLVDKLQVERGMSAAFIKGAKIFDKIQKQRQKVDVELKEVRKLKDTKDFDSIFNHLNELQKYRAYVTSKSPKLSLHLKNYTSLIKTLLSSYDTVAKYGEADGVGREISSIRILEAAKESQGKLRAILSSALAENKPAFESEKKISKFFYQTQTFLFSPLLKISKKLHLKIANFKDKQSWKHTFNIFEHFIQTFTKGDFGIDSQEFFKAASLNVEDIYNAIQEQDEYAHQKIQEKTKILEEEMLFLIILSILLITIAIFTAIKTSNPILNGVQQITDFALKLKDGDLTYKLSSEFNDEIGQTLNALDQASLGMNSLLLDIVVKSQQISERGEDLNNSAKQLKLSSNDLNSRSSSMSSACEEMTAGSRTMEQSLNDSAKKIKSSAETSNQVSAATSNVSKNINSSLKVINSLGDDIKNMSDSLRGVAKAGQENTKTIENVSSSMLGIAQNVDSVVSGIESTLKLSEDVSTAISNIAKTIEGVSYKSDDTVQEISNALNGVTEINKVLKQVASKADNINSSVQGSSAAVEEMYASTSQVVEVTQKTAEMVSNVTKTSKESVSTMNTLAQSVKEIDDIVLLIDDIARQTNLLALNANIEASRAGEAGKGFAVVAHEVKTLAKDTQDNTQVIKDKTTEIQTFTNSAVELINDISKSMGSLNDMTSSVLQSVTEQKSVTNDLSKTMLSVAGDVSSMSKDIISCSDKSSKVSEIVSTTNTVILEMSNEFQTVQKASSQILENSNKSAQASKEIFKKSQFVNKETKNNIKQSNQMKTDFIKMNTLIQSITSDGENVDKKAQNIKAIVDQISESIKHTAIDVNNVSGLIEDIETVSIGHLGTSKEFLEVSTGLSKESIGVLSASKDTLKNANIIEGISKNIDSLTNEVNTSVSSFKLRDNDNEVAQEKLQEKLQEPALKIVEGQHVGFDDIEDINDEKKEMQDIA